MKLYIVIYLVTGIIIIPIQNNDRMQQPLCHLYFLLVMEHLQASSYNQNEVPGLVRSASLLHSILERGDCEDAVLLWLEFQAVIQVLIQKFAICLDPDHLERLGDIQLVLDDLNM